MDTPEYYRFRASAEARGRWEEAWRRASALEKRARDLHMSLPYADIHYGPEMAFRMRVEWMEADVAARNAQQIATRLRLEYLEVRDRLVIHQPAPARSMPEIFGE